MAGPNGGSGQIFKSTASTSGVVTAPVNIKPMSTVGFQTRSDGTQVVTVDVQVSNVPERGDGYGATVRVRDDSYASADWVTATTNTMTNTGSAFSRLDELAFVSHRSARVRLTSAAGTPSMEVYVGAQGQS